jgi:hypothetical protein
VWRGYEGKLWHEFGRGTDGLAPLLYHRDLVMFAVLYVAADETGSVVCELCGT